MGRVAPARLAREAVSARPPRRAACRPPDGGGEGEGMSQQIAALSGGKDSTALVLRLAELGEDFECLFTPTGNELPELRAHLDNVVRLIGKPLVTPPNRSLGFWINE